MLAQRGARVLLAEQPAPAQFGQHQFDEIVEPAGQPRRHHVEAIGGFTLDGIGTATIGSIILYHALGLAKPADNTDASH